MMAWAAAGGTVSSSIAASSRCTVLVVVWATGGTVLLVCRGSIRSLRNLWALCFLLVSYTTLAS